MNVCGCRVGQMTALTRCLPSRAITKPTSKQATA
nr:MAG TPA: hypothetical protein [Caudoviricetes sp.]